MKVSVKSNKTGRKLTSIYFGRELLAIDEQSLVEEMTQCDCQPVGETNVVECNCYEEWEEYELTFEDD